MRAERWSRTSGANRPGFPGSCSGGADKQAPCRLAGGRAQNRKPRGVFGSEPGECGVPHSHMRACDHAIGHPSRAALPEGRTVKPGLLVSGGIPGYAGAC